MDTQFSVRRLAMWAWSDLPNLASLLLFLAITALLFRSVGFALVVVASLGFHEMGHAAVLAAYRLPFRIHFGVVGAWTWSPAEARLRLTHWQNALIHLAGPLFSVLLALLALGIHTFWRPSDAQLLTLANFSAQVGLLNLLPLGIMTDGGKIVRRIVDSLPSQRRGWSALLPMLLTVTLGAAYVLIAIPRTIATAWITANAIPFLLGLLLIGVWLGGSVLVESARRWNTPALGPIDSARSALMTHAQVYWLLFGMWGLLSITLTIAVMTPFWLSADILFGSLRNIMAVIFLLFKALSVASMAN